MLLKWLLSILTGALGDALVGIVREWFGARETRSARVEADRAHERAGAAEAANETQQTISDIANARADLPPGPDSPADLARRMRERAAGDRAAGRGDQDAGK